MKKRERERERWRRRKKTDEKSEVMRDERLCADK